MPVSIKDIAKKANVSPSTVSRALNNHPRISTETKRQLQELARSMGYVPSQVARSLVTQQSATIGVAVADFLDPFYASLLAGIEDFIIANDYDLFVSSFYRDWEREKKLFNAFHEKRLAGIIVAGSLIDEGYLPQSKHLIPVVLVNCVSYPYSVSVDKLTGAKLAMEHLIGLGHCRIAYVSQGIPFSTELLRLEGYRAVLRENDIPPDDALIVPGDGSVVGGIQAVERLLELDNPPTAFFCFNDMTAIGAIHALHQKGYRVPDDFSIVGFDDLEIAAYYYPTLTTIRQPVYLLGHRSATMLFQLIQGNQTIEAEMLEPELIVRGSTAPVPIRSGKD